MKNIISINFDDMLNVEKLRYAFGPAIQTPNLDRLMGRGVYFENAYATTPTCNASRAATLSGLSAHKTGIFSNDDVDLIETPLAVRMLPEHLASLGYETAGVGKLLHYYQRQGEIFQHFRDLRGWDIQSNDPDRAVGYAPVTEDKMRDAESVAWAIDYLENRDGTAPFFLSLGIMKPHLGWVVPKPYYDLYDRSEIVVPTRDGMRFEELPDFYKQFIGWDQSQWTSDPEVWRDLIHGYLAAASFADAQLGKLLDTLDALELWDRSTVVLWSDHGFHVGDHDTFLKFTLWENAAAVPMIVVDPDAGSPGMRVSTPVSLLDLYPTILDLVGAPPPGELDGLSLRPLMEGLPLPSGRPGVFTQAYGSFSVTDGTWRYTLYQDGDRELFHFPSDKFNQRNLADEPAQAATLTAYDALLTETLMFHGLRRVSPGERSNGNGTNEVFVVVGAGEAAGGAGDDTYYVTEGARVVESASGGTDTVLVTTKAAYTLPENVENGHHLSRVATRFDGNALDNKLIGGPFQNTIHGLGGDDIIFGSWHRSPSGAFVDRLYGGDGDDRIQGRSGSDWIEGGAGNDFLEGDGANHPFYGDGAVDRILGGAGDDTAYGGLGGDTIHGEAGDDRLLGEVGDDELSGGTGRDVLIGGHGHDQMWGGPDDDRFVFGPGWGSDAAWGGDGGDAAVFEIPLRYAVLSRYSEGIVLSDARTGDRVALFEVEALHFGANVIDVGRVGLSEADLMGVGADTLMWLGPAGRVDGWRLAGGERVGAVKSWNLGERWRLEAIGQVDGLSGADVLWRDAETGRVDLWRFDGAARIGTSTLLTTRDWSVLGIAQLDGSGGAEILWRGPTGQVHAWALVSDQTGTGPQIQSRVIAEPGLDWQPFTFVDLDGNGIDDILWTHERSGRLDVWWMRPGGRGGADVLGGSLAASDIVASGDFDGDGVEELLLHRTDGAVALIGIAPGGGVEETPLGRVGGAWEVAAAGDYNGDGTTDIVWRDGATRRVDLWFMGDTGRADWTTLGRFEGWTLLDL